MAKKAKSNKKSNLRKYASIGLWISGVALLAGVILLVVKLIASMGLYTLSSPKIFNWALWICLALIIIGPALFALIDPQKVREFLTGRQARYGSNAVILLVAFLGILIVVNVIAFQNPIKGDWTEDKSHTLAPETLATLKALPSPVHAVAFYTSNVSSTSADQLLKSIQDKSSGKFSYEFVNPTQNPVKAQQYQVTQDATIVLLLGSNQELVTNATEQDLTNAMVRLMNPGKRTVYFLTGHGEHDIQNSGQDAYTRVSTVLGAKNYTVKPLNLLAQNQIPADAKVVVAAGPLQPVSAQETALLSTYLTHGGALVVMEEPTVMMQAGSEKDPLADYLASTWGITLDNDLVIDPQQNPAVVVVADTQNYGSHPITDKLNGRISFFPTTRSLSSQTVANVQATILVKTISRAWGLTDFSVLQTSTQLTFDPTKDLAGPLSIAIAAENTTNQGRVVVIGNSTFANDTYFDQYANSDLLVNTVDWAAGQENVINLTAKTPITRQMNMLSSLTLLLIGIAFILLLPGAVVAGGVASWLIRRARG